MRLAEIFGSRGLQPISRGKAIRMARKAPLFRSINNNVLSDLIDESSQTFYDAETFILRQGDIADKVYMVIEGRVRVVYQDNQEQIEVAILGPGDVFGEMGVLDRQPRSANVVTMERTNCLEVPGTVFMNALNQIREE